MVLFEKNKMPTSDEYLTSVLQQADDVYTIFQNLKDKPGDIEIIRRELAKITGLFQALVNKLETNKEFSDYQYLISPIRHFLNSHDFFREIETMSLLYSDDPMRLRNLRLVVLDALEEKNLMEYIKSILRSKKNE